MVIPRRVWSPSTFERSSDSSRICEDTSEVVARIATPLDAASAVESMDVRKQVCRDFGRLVPTREWPPLVDHEIRRDIRTVAEHMLREFTPPHSQSCHAPYATVPGHSAPQIGAVRGLNGNGRQRIDHRSALRRASSSLNAIVPHRLPPMTEQHGGRGVRHRRRDSASSIYRATSPTGPGLPSSLLFAVGYAGDVGGKVIGTPMGGDHAAHHEDHLSGPRATQCDHRESTLQSDTAYCSLS
jgi:hypothetical protein